ncbi:unnamed protein product, partial [Brenthis ino]
MESCPVRRRSRPCPILCVAKALLFALVAVFILYLPLGDPRDQCGSNCEGKLLGVCCLCDIYNASIKLGKKPLELVEHLLCTLQNLLYDLKMKFYAMLKRVDHDDLCRSICSSDSTVKAEDGKDRPGCRCSRRCCRKRAQS